MTMPDVSPELPSRTWRALLALLRRLPQAGLSRSMGRIAAIPLPRPARRAVLGAFARAFGIDVTEAERPIDDYPSIGAFFVRRLRPGARDWPPDDGVAGSPVDGITGRFGRIQDGRLIQAKGRWYSAAALLADEDVASGFNGGSYLTIYLSPRHYHRIHAPTGGEIPLARHVAGALFPVNAPSVLHVPDLFARNERLICYVDGPLGRVAVVAVGAYNVGGISAAFDPAWVGEGQPVTNRPGAAGESRRYEPGIRVRQGDELMAFHLGSTVVLLFEPGLAVLEPGLAPEAELRLGQPVARAPSAGPAGGGEA